MGCFLRKYYICVLKHTSMTLGQFRYKYSGINPKYVVWGQLLDTSNWGSLRLGEKIDSYIDKNVQKYLMREHRDLMTDLHLAKYFGMHSREKELSARVKELSDRRQMFSAAKFFTEHCGWGWGGASMKFLDVDYVSGDYVICSDDGPACTPSIKTVRIPVAVMDVYRCGNRIPLCIYGNVYESAETAVPLPDAVSDVLLYPVIVEGTLVSVLLYGYSEYGKGVLLKGDDIGSVLHYAAENTERYLTGALYRIARDDYRREERARIERFKARRESWEWEAYSHPEPREWYSELDTLEALGYDVDAYLERRHYYWDSDL